MIVKQNGTITDLESEMEKKEEVITKKTERIAELEEKIVPDSKTVSEQ